MQDLIHIIENDNRYQLKRFIGQGLNPHTVLGNGLNLLEEAAYRGKFNICLELMMQGVGSNKALSLAIEQGYKSIAQMLISYDIGQHTIPEGPVSAKLAELQPNPIFLYHAITANNLFLVEKAATVLAQSNIPEKLRYNIVAYTCYKNNPNLVDVLIAKNFPIDIFDTDMLSPLYWAAANENITLTKTLIGHGANTGTTLKQILAENNEKAYKILMDATDDNLLQDAIEPQPYIKPVDWCFITAAKELAKHIKIDDIHIEHLVNIYLEDANYIALETLL